jgi:hypothetical protein
MDIFFFVKSFFTGFKLLQLNNATNSQKKFHARWIAGLLIHFLKENSLT